VGSALTFEIKHKCSKTKARAGVATTLHGEYQTPAFMTVGTKGTVKGIYPGMLKQAGCEVLLGNTYHLLLRPGPDVVESLGGMHTMMGWDNPILTDSGGYQAYSMANINAIDDDGVTFKSILNGEMIRMGPDEAIDIQNKLGADIIMAFDDCPPSVDPDVGPTNQTRLKLATKRDSDKGKTYDHAARLRASNERTVRWLERCKKVHRRPHDQSLFGIVQGGTDLDERRWSAEHIANIELPGYAIGGVAVGETADEIDRVVQFTAPLLPEEKPRYLMGVGYERDILSAVLSGVDMFDCVLPTRNGRSAGAFTKAGQIKLKNAKFTRDTEVIEPGCDCHACDPAKNGLLTVDGKGFSRGTIRHLFSAGEMLGPILVSLHNVRHFQRLMLDIRQAIRDDDWLSFAAEWPVAVDGLPDEHRGRLGL
jgi:queuine tRNA-ribosyltransferase